MTSHILIAIVGLPASGKSTAIESVKYVGPIVTMGDVIREEIMMRKLDPTPENIGKIAQMLREESGDDVIALRVIEKIKLLPNPIILIDGIRSIVEVDRFREYGTLYVIAITCPNAVRFERIQRRGRSDDTTQVSQIRARDQRELSFGLGIVIENADYVIVNDSTLESLQVKVRNLVKGLI